MVATHPTVGQANNMVREKARLSNTHMAPLRPVKRATQVRATVKATINKGNMEHLVDTSSMANRHPTKGISAPSLYHPPIKTSRTFANIKSQAANNLVKILAATASTRTLHTSKVTTTNQGTRRTRITHKPKVHTTRTTPMRPRVRAREG
jgi:hypothetical protein